MYLAFLQEVLLLPSVCSVNESHGTAIEVHCDRFCFISSVYVCYELGYIWGKFIS